MKKIFIDAGHNFSGFNTGAVANGLREQDITFDVAKYLGELLEAAGLDVKLSRPTLQTNLGWDNGSSVNTRWQMANAWGADYFISIHANAGGGTGAETLYFSQKSLEFAQTVQDVYSEEMGLRNRRIWRRDDIGVVRWTNMPSILVETAFIDSPAQNPDVEILRSKRLEMAKAIAKGVLRYLNIEIPAAEPPARFNTLDELPTWARPTIEKLAGKKFLTGDGQGLDLSLDMVRIFVVHDRIGIYD
ncbi:MAG: N-acetylmuramoyl-L-alanine amidase [Defluviitaleaceae bacterium]|nr:N-acetylmuramoyl-L-alanine amidase [Defluviitaleaceae bacterium]